MSKTFGDINEGDGCVWMNLPSDPSVSVRTKIREGETAKEAGFRLAGALAALFTSSLMSTVGHVTPAPSRRRD